MGCKEASHPAPPSAPVSRLTGAVVHDNPIWPDCRAGKNYAAPCGSPTRSARQQGRNFTPLSANWQLGPRAREGSWELGAGLGWGWGPGAAPGMRVCGSRASGPSGFINKPAATGVGFWTPPFPSALATTAANGLLRLLHCALPLLRSLLFALWSLMRYMRDVVRFDVGCVRWDVGCEERRVLLSSVIMCCRLSLSGHGPWPWLPFVSCGFVSGQWTWTANGLRGGLM
jgi:hypothetical protein